jgi:hypothetical protein
MKMAFLKKGVINLAKSQFLQAVPMPPPMIAVVDYIVTNHAYIRGRKCHLIAHPRNILRKMPIALTSATIDDFQEKSAIENIHDPLIHDAVTTSFAIAKSIIIFF